MLENISWKQYGISLLGFSLLYYAVVGWRFYRYELAQYFQLGRQSTEVDEKQDAYLRAAAQQFSHELPELINLARHQQLQKTELLLALKTAVIHYQALAKTAYQPAVNNLIQQQCREQLNMHLQAPELEQLWQ